MRIAFLCTSSLDNASPRGRWLPLARELAQRGHEPHLLMLHPTFDQLSTRVFTQEGVHVQYVGQMHVYGQPGQRRYYRPAQLAWVSLSSAKALVRAALAVRPDVIHVCKPQPINGLAGLLAARWSRCKLLVDCDDYEAEANRFGTGLAGRLQKSLVRYWEDHLPRWAVGVTVNTRFLQHRNAQLGVDPRRIVYVPNGVRVDSREQKAMSHKPLTVGAADFLPSVLCSVPTASTLLYVGTMSKIAHGVDLLIESFAQVLAQIPSARLLMVGDGDDRPALIQQAEQLGISQSIVWVGPVPAEQVREYWSLAHCSIDPVYDSPGARGRSPLKIVESLAAGVPVVTGDVGDRREMIGDAGRIVIAGDAAALAEGICAQLTQAPISPALIQAQAAHYTWAILAEDWLRIYSASE